MKKQQLSLVFPNARFYEEDEKLAFHFGRGQIISYDKKHNYRVSFVEPEDNQFDVTHKCYVVKTTLSKIKNGEFFFEHERPGVARIMIDRNLPFVLSAFKCEIYEAGYKKDDDSEVFKVVCG